MRDFSRSGNVDGGTLFVVRFTPRLERGDTPVPRLSSVANNQQMPFAAKTKITRCGLPSPLLPPIVRTHSWEEEATFLFVILLPSSLRTSKPESERRNDVRYAFGRSRRRRADGERGDREEEENKKTSPFFQAAHNDDDGEEKGGREEEGRTGETFFPPSSSSPFLFSFPLPPSLPTPWRIPAPSSSLFLTSVTTTTTM